MPTDKHIYNGCKNEIVLIKLPLNATYTGQGYRQRVWAMKIASSCLPAMRVFCPVSRRCRRDSAPFIYFKIGNIGEGLSPDDLFSVRNPPFCKIIDYGFQRSTMFCKLILYRDGLCV